MKFPSLETQHLILRELNDNDANALFCILSNKSAMKFWDTPPHESIETARISLRSMISAWNKNEGVTWGIEKKDSKLIIGQLSLHSLNIGNNEAQLGYIIHPEYWGNGYGSESLNAVINYCFNKTCIKSILAEVDPNNKSSVKILVNHKFKYIKTKTNDFKLNDKCYDTDLYVLSESSIRQ